MSPRVRRTVDVRREEILASTADLLETIGLAEIRVADVARRLGVSTALVFYHFGTKDALVAAAMAHSFERDYQHLTELLVGTEPIAKLRRLIGSFGGPGSRQGWRTWIDACAVAQREPVMRATLQEVNARYERTIQEVLEEGVRAGAYACVDPNASARRLLALNDGLSTAIMVMESVSDETLTDWIRLQVAAETGVDLDLLRAEEPS